MRWVAFFILGILLIGASVAVWQVVYSPRATPNPSEPISESPNPPPSTASTDTSPSLVEPVAEFTARITKKRFGTYVTPENSPVSPERFTGFHTGVDVEYGDVGDEVPVRAIADGTVVLAKTAQGYGGVTVITHTIDGAERSVLYGHLDPADLPAVGATITRGLEIGRLGDGRTAETDGERKHLHFTVRVDASLLLLGYVQRESDLSEWIDPLSLTYVTTD